jgi:hypothetical protein
VSGKRQRRRQVRRGQQYVVPVGEIDYGLHVPIVDPVTGAREIARLTPRDLEGLTATEVCRLVLHSINVASARLAGHRAPEVGR